MEDYKKKYEDAIERCKKEFNFNNLAYSHEEIRERLERVFPELKETEDEMVRKWIRNELESKYVVDNIVNNVMADKAFVWLEKQGEQKPTDKVEPKFKVGDWITDYTSTFQIVKIEDEWYIADDGDKVCFDVIHQYYHLWTIQDAKDGDVLSNKNGAIFINVGNNEENRVTLDCYCYLSVQGNFCIEERKTGSWLYKIDIQPATKEQRDLLFTKMKEAGYEWDDEKKELKKIEQKSVWSEEDEKMLDSFLHKLEVCEFLSNKEITWIKNKLNLSKKE